LLTILHAANHSVCLRQNRDPTIFCGDEYSPPHKLKQAAQQCGVVLFEPQLT